MADDATATKSEGWQEQPQRDKLWATVARVELVYIGKSGCEEVWTLTPCAACGKLFSSRESADSSEARESFYADIKQFAEHELERWRKGEEVKRLVRWRIVPETYRILGFDIPDDVFLVSRKA